MYLSEEQKTIGRRNFLKAVAVVPAFAALGGLAPPRGQVRGGPVKIAMIGTGGMGRELLTRYQKEFCDLKAICDVNPSRRGKVAEFMVQNGWPRPTEYDDWQELLQKEDLEAVHIATPLWTHAEMTVTALNAGKHVLCEKMMAKSAAECQQMIAAAKKNKRVLEIGYQRFYNPIYQAAYANIIKKGVLGDIHHVRLTWHRNASWRRTEEPPSANYDPRKWGYPDWEHLLNWRVYKKYSEGLLCELGSHQLSATNWFLDSQPEAVYTSAGTYEYKDGREVNDHVYAIFDYPGGRTATFSTIQSNAFEDAYEMFLGTKGTLILTHEAEAFLFNEGEPRSMTRVEPAGMAADSSSSQPPATAARPINPDTSVARIASFRDEVAEFCVAIRTGSPVRCGPENAMKAAVAVLVGNSSAEKQTRLKIS